MTLLIFFAIVFATIVFAIVLQRIIHCPILVGFAFFAGFLIVAAIFNSTIYVIAAIALGILAFIVAFLDCIFRRSRFFRNNSCLRCDYDDDDNNYGRGSGGRNNCNNCNCNNQDDTLTIVNSNGRIIARINGNSITCNDNNNCGCGCNNNSVFNENNILGTTVNTNDGLAVITNSDSGCNNCGCNSRNYRYRR